MDSVLLMLLRYALFYTAGVLTGVSLDAETRQQVWVYKEQAYHHVKDFLKRL